MPEYFQYLNEYFDKIYVLSLPRLKERVDYIHKVLDGLDFELFEGTDKMKTSLGELKSKGIYATEEYQRFYKKPTEISLGMLCCSLGHLHIYEDIVKRNFQKTLILEDDVVPLDTLGQFPDIIKELPPNWELFYLGYEKNEKPGFTARIKQEFYKIFPAHAQLKMTKQIFSNYYPSTLTKHISRSGFHDCTHAYAVSLEGARKLLQQQKPVRFHPDNLLAYMITTGQLRGYISKPKLFNQLSAFRQEIESLTDN